LPEKHERTAKISLKLPEFWESDLPLAPLETESRSGPARNRRFVFGDFEVDLRRGCLTRGGKEIFLRPKTFAMFQYLLEHAGELVSREELLAAVWPGAVVTDDSIAQCLLELRKALDDNRRSIIRTVPRRGLIFDLPVTIQDTSPATEPQRSRLAVLRNWRTAALLVPVAALLLAWFMLRGPDSNTVTTPAPTPATKSIAVLRFADMSSAGDQSYLADGFSEEIMHWLAQSQSLRVIARVSSFAVAGQPAATIARKLGVSHILEGSVRKEANSIRVTVQLVDAATSSHIWSKTYDRDLDHILDVQREIASAVANVIEVSLGDVDDRQGIDPHAFELFLEGRYYYLRRGSGDLERARDRFNQVISISPEFARAWVGLAAAAGARLHDTLPGKLTTEERERLREIQRNATEKALQYGPNLPEAHIRAAAYFAQSGERERAREHVEIARSIDPHHWLVRVTLANELRFSGRIEDSIVLVQREIQRDPLNWVLRANMVGLLLWAHRIEDARAELDNWSELMPSQTLQSSTLRGHTARVRILLGDFEGAIAAIEAMPEGAERSALQAMTHHAMGLTEEADNDLEQVTAAAGSEWNAFYAAEVHAFKREVPKALESLHRIRFAKSCEDAKLAQFVYYSPFLARLNGSPAWEQYRSRVLQTLRGCLLGLSLDYGELSGPDTAR
jgi:TolB-like protein/DNA-binding winged helix-turn-helix (wHTH) protein